MTTKRKRQPMMSTKQYQAALRELGLTPASKLTEAAYGKSVRTLIRLNQGDPIDDTLALLIGMYLKHGISITVK